MESSWQGKSVFVVEDNSLIREEICNLYNQLGLEIVGEAANALAAIEALQKSPSDLVSLDIILPGMHGVDCFRELRRQNNKLRFVFLSYLCRENDLIELLDGEIAPIQFVAKPIVFERLRLAVESAFDQEISV